MGKAKNGGDTEKEELTRNIRLDSGFGNRDNEFPNMGS